MFQLNLRGKDPIYEQIRGQITQFVELGVMEPGEKLPSVRQLAQENAINPNTVARAYQRLEEEGIIVTVPKKGAYVADKASASGAEVRQVVASLRDRGVTRASLMAAVEEIYSEVKDNA